MDKFIFGKGNRSIFTVEELLNKFGLHPEVLQSYLDHIGNGLSVGGLIVGSKDEVIRLSEDTSSIVVMAPDCEVVEVPCECDHQEDDHSAQGQEAPKDETLSVADAVAPQEEVAAEVQTTEQPAADAENPQTTENTDTVTQ